MKVRVGRYAYLWEGAEPLVPGDRVLLPENWLSRTIHGAGPFEDTVTAVGSDYDGPMSRVIAKIGACHDGCGGGALPATAQPQPAGNDRTGPDTAGPHPGRARTAARTRTGTLTSENAP